MGLPAPRPSVNSVINGQFLSLRARCLWNSLPRRIQTLLVCPSNGHGPWFPDLTSPLAGAWRPLEWPTPSRVMQTNIAIEWASYFTSKKAEKKQEWGRQGHTLFFPSDSFFLLYLHSRVSNLAIPARGGSVGPLLITTIRDSWKRHFLACRSTAASHHVPATVSPSPVWMTTAILSSASVLERGDPVTKSRKLAVSSLAAHEIDPIPCSFRSYSVS